MFNNKKQMEEITILRIKIIKAMAKPLTARQISEMVGISCYRSQYHIYSLIKEGYAKQVGKIKLKFATANLYKTVSYMGEYIMKPRELPMVKEKKIKMHEIIKNKNSRVFYLLDDVKHFKKMNASKTKSKVNYFVNGSTLSQ